MSRTSDMMKLSSTRPLLTRAGCLTLTLQRLLSLICSQLGRQPDRAASAREHAGRDARSQHCRRWALAVPAGREDLSISTK
eukprot:2750385-Pleurochrysis_carterae.AAC.1